MVSNLVVEIAIYNFDLFHTTLMLRVLSQLIYLVARVLVSMEVIESLASSASAATTYDIDIAMFLIS